MIKTSESYKIADLLKSNSLYKVPRFQRSFSWEKEQLERFWYDILETMDEERKDYFLGSMIFKKDEEDSEGRIEIIDGQQRMATITIIFACIRDEYTRTMTHQQHSYEIEKDYIGNRDKRTNEWFFKVKLNKYDEAYFNSTIQRVTAETKERRFGPKKNIPQSHRLIRKAYDFFKDNISKELQKYTDSETKKNFLFDLEDTIADKFKIIGTYVDNEDDAFLIFETLNERGLELSIADLLKNYIYSKTEKNSQNLEPIQRGWEDIMALLRDNKEFSNFLRCFWNSCFKLVRKNKLYQTYKEYLKEQKNLLKFVNSLRDEAKIYKSFIEPTENDWKGGKQKLINLLKDLRLLNVRQVYPLLLSGYRKLDPKDFIKLLELSLNLTFRYSIICNQNPNQLERVYSELAVDLHNNRTDLNKIEKKLKTLYPQDELFINEFSSKKIKNSQVGRYILIQINNYLIKENEELQVIKDPEKVDLEHIMPKTLSPQWEEYVKKHKINHGELIDMIGNLTLLPSPKNKDLSNKLFGEKCEKYKNCFLPTTKSINKYKLWNEENILKRQNNLARVAKEIWKF